MIHRITDIDSTENQMDALCQDVLTEFVLFRKRTIIKMNGLFLLWVMLCENIRLKNEKFHKPT
jgi:hypothetical protein